MQVGDTITALSTALAKVTSERDELAASNAQLCRYLDLITEERDELKAERDEHTELIDYLRGECHRLYALLVEEKGRP